jgi:disulfide bond formation protein DsbB
MTNRQSLRADHIAFLVGAGGTCLFLGALGFQYIGGIAPCEMCQWQRWAHIGAALTGILAVTMTKADSTARALAWIAILFVLTSGLIGAYQTGMEYHLLPGPASCSGHRYVLGSNAPPPEVQCDVVAWSLFGLSMASYNALCSFLIAALGALGLSKNAQLSSGRVLGQGNAA